MIVCYESPQSPNIQYIHLIRSSSQSTENIAKNQQTASINTYIRVFIDIFIYLFIYSFSIAGTRLMTPR